MRLPACGTGKLVGGDPGLAMVVVPVCLAERRFPQATGPVELITHDPSET